MKEYRFVVGRIGTNQSSSWKVWVQGNEAYLLQRGIAAKHTKFSFHSTGNCRWAQINPSLNGRQRVILEWTRDPVPDAGLGKGSLLLTLVFPTDHLSSFRELGDEKLHWIEPAEPGYGICIQFMLTKEDPNDIRNIFKESQHGQLLACQQLRNGMHLCATKSIRECGPIDLVVPKDPVLPGQVFGEMRFPDRDEQNTGRPARMVLMDGNTTPPDVWELGGYEITRLASP